MVSWSLSFRIDRVETAAPVRSFSLFNPSILSCRSAFHHVDENTLPATFRLLTISNKSEQRHYQTSDPTNYQRKSLDPTIDIIVTKFTRLALRNAYPTTKKSLPPNEADYHNGPYNNQHDLPLYVLLSDAESEPCLTYKESCRRSNTYYAYVLVAQTEPAFRTLRFAVSKTGFDR